MRHPRAHEDEIIRNVLSFHKSLVEVKVLFTKETTRLLAANFELARLKASGHDRQPQSTDTTVLSGFPEA
jgi:hypothetical protein